MIKYNNFRILLVKNFQLKSIITQTNLSNNLLSALFVVTLVRFIKTIRSLPLNPVYTVFDQLDYFCQALKLCVLFKLEKIDKASPSPKSKPKSNQKREKRFWPLGLWAVTYRPDAVNRGLSKRPLAHSIMFAALALLSSP